MNPRIAYIELKAGEIVGPARIERIETSKTGKTVYHAGRVLRATTRGFLFNHIDVESGDEYWIPGPRRDVMDCLYPGIVEIDDDVREEYWCTIRKKPGCAQQTSFRSDGKYTRRRPHTHLNMRGSSSRGGVRRKS